MAKTTKIHAYRFDEEDQAELAALIEDMKPTHGVVTQIGALRWAIREARKSCRAAGRRLKMSDQELAMIRGRAFAQKTDSDHDA